MTVTERVAYLKGLAEGLDLSKETKEGKILAAIIDVLDDVAYEISDLQEALGEIGEQVDMIDEDLDALEEIVYEDDECGCEDEDDEDDEDYEIDGDLYEVTCPNCGDTIYLDEDMIDEGEMACPGCGENLEFVFDEDDSAGEKTDDQE